MRVIEFATAGAVIGMLVAVVCQAGIIYRWTDDNGVKRFSHLPPTDHVRGL